MRSGPPGPPYGDSWHTRQPKKARQNRSISPHPSHIEVYGWEIAAQPVSIRMPIQLIERISDDVARGLNMRTSSDVTGILVGRIKKGTGATIIVEDYRLASYTGARTGASFGSDEQLAEIIKRWKYSGGRRHVVGLFRSQRHGRLILQEDDLTETKRLLPRSETVFLLIRSSADREYTGRLFLRQAKALLIEEEYGEFAFDAGALASRFGAGDLMPGRSARRFKTESDRTVVPAVREELLEQFQLATGMQSLASRLSDLVAATVRYVSAGRMLGAAVTHKLANQTQHLWGTLSEMATALWNGLVEMLSRPAAAPLESPVTEQLQPELQAIETQSLWSRLSDLVAATVRQISAGFRLGATVTHKLARQTQHLWGAISQTAPALWSKLVGIVALAVRQISAGFRLGATVTHKLANQTQHLWGAISETAPALWSELAGVVALAVRQVSAGFRLGATVTHKLADQTQHFWGAISETAPALWRKLAAMFARRATAPAETSSMEQLEAGLSTAPAESLAMANAQREPHPIERELLWTHLTAIGTTRQAWRPSRATAVYTLEPLPARRAITPVPHPAEPNATSSPRKHPPHSWLYIAASWIVAAGVTFWSLSGPSISQHLNAEPVAKPAIVSYPIGLAVKRNGRLLDIVWDPYSAASVNAEGGAMIIRDGSLFTNVPLDAAEIRTAHLSYSPQADDLTIELKVVRENGGISSESVRILDAHASSGH